MGKLKKLVTEQWQTIIFGLAGFCVIVFLFGWQLGTLPTTQPSPIEVQTINQSSSLDLIISDPTNLLIKKPLFLLQELGVNSLASLRAVSALYGALSVVLFYFLLKQLHTRRVAVLTSFLFATSAWLLGVSRIISPYVLLPFGVILLGVLMYYLKTAKKPNLALVVSGVLLAALAYTPGFLLLLISLVIVNFGKVRSVLKDSKWWAVLLVGVFFVLLLTPLLYAVLMKGLSPLTALGLPTVIEPVEWLKRFFVIPAYLFARGPLEPSFNLARLPLLDIMSAALLFVGIYAYFLRRSLARVSITLTLGLGSCVLIALNGSLWLPLLLPLVFMIIAMGVTLLLQQWFTVFPKNPVARRVGVTIAIVALAFVPLYNLTRYFIAWSNNPITKATFSSNALED